MSLFKKAASMSSAVFLSRILGLVREQVFAYVLGAGFFSDVFRIAFRVPNMLRDLLAEGALSHSFVAVFSKIEDPQKEKEFVYAVFGFLFWIFIAVSMLLYFWAPEIITLLAKNFLNTPGKFELTVKASRVFIPFIIMTSYAAIFAGILNSKNYFFLPSMGSVFFNLASILGGTLALLSFKNSWWGSVALNSETSFWSFSALTLLGGLLMWIILWPHIFLSFKYSGIKMLNSGFSLKKYKDNTNLKKLFKIYLPAMLALAATQINVLVNSRFATDVGPGAVSWLQVAYRFVHLPIGMVGVALATVSLPSLSEYVKKKQWIQFSSTLREAISLALFLLGGIVSGLFLYRVLIVEVIFERGQFSAIDTLATADAVWGYCFGIVFFVLLKMAITSFYALEKVVWAFGVSILSIVVNYLLCSYLGPKMGHQGLALSASISALVQCLLLFGILSFFKVKFMSMQIAKDFLIVALIIVLLFLIREYGFNDVNLLALKGFVGKYLSFLIVALVNALAYFLCIYFLSSNFRQLILKKRA